MSKTVEEKYPLTPLEIEENPNFEIVDNQLYCQGKLVRYCGGEKIRTYKCGVLLCRSIPETSKFDTMVNAYQFINNNGDSIFDEQDFITIYGEHDEESYEKVDDLHVFVCDEMLYVKHDEQRQNFVEVFDYDSGLGFCAPHLNQVYDMVIEQKNSNGLNL